jgi:hypothetical protein
MGEWLEFCHFVFVSRVAHVLTPSLCVGSTGQEYSYAADMWGFGLSILACALGCFPLQGSQKGASGGYWGLVAAGTPNLNH